jgi:8-oxo-dGTP pyrophosphatase MutT (NUDIX family)
VSAAPILRPRTKAVVYATSGRRLLIFRQPDYPDVGWQPPGGTVDADEPVEDAARREFAEETGLLAKGDFTPLGACTYRYVANGFDHIHERHFFHLALDGTYPEAFETIEATPEEGGPPIRFAFLWRSLDDPSLSLHNHLDALLPELRRRLAEMERA